MTDGQKVGVVGMALAAFWLFNIRRNEQRAQQERDIEYQRSMETIWRRTGVR